MTHQEAKDLSDKFNSRTDIDLIEDGIRAAANKGLYIYNSKPMGSVQASEYKEYFKILGFKVSKCKAPSYDRFGVVDGNIYELAIAWL